MLAYHWLPSMLGKRKKDSLNAHARRHLQRTR